MIDRAPDITRRIDGLVRMGIVERARSSEDRRVVLTRITQQGLDLLQRIADESEQMETELERRLTSDEWKQLTSLCERLFSE